MASADAAPSCCGTDAAAAEADDGDGWEYAFAAAMTFGNEATDDDAAAAVAFVVAVVVVVVAAAAAEEVAVGAADG